jgi:glycosyltransferase involved in cell wall biosynthesis
VKVRFVGSEWFSWGQHGGYGAFNRKLSSELVKRGIEVEAIVQKIMPTQKDVGDFEIIDGVKVITLPRGKLGKFRTDLYKSDADIIHSQNGSLDTYLSFKRNPHTPKVVTIQDLRTKQELVWIGKAESKNVMKRTWGLVVDNLYGQAIRMADVCTCQADLLKPKIKEKYSVTECQLLPNFVDIPEESSIKKSKEPSAVFLGRLDPIKRPELYFQIASMMPWVTFMF